MSSVKERIALCAWFLNLSGVDFLLCFCTCGVLVFCLVHTTVEDPWDKLIAWCTCPHIHGCMHLSPASEQALSFYYRRGPSIIWRCTKGSFVTQFPLCGVLYRSRLCKFPSPGRVSAPAVIYHFLFMAVIFQNIFRLKNGTFLHDSILKTTHSYCNLIIVISF